MIGISAYNLNVTEYVPFRLHFQRRGYSLQWRRKQEKVRGAQV